MQIDMFSVLKHVEWIIWSSKAVRLANMGWRARRPYVGDVVIDVGGLNAWLFRWGIESGLMPDPGKVRKISHSAYVSILFDTHRDEVKREARRYYLMHVEEQS